MLRKLQQRKQDQKGFTIIEVLIVLAIAGLILLIVFLAVPALQRASRNTSRKNDVSALGSAISNYIDNNGGTLPTAVGDNGTTSVVEVCAPAASASNSEQATMGEYVTAPGKKTTCTGGGAVSDGDFSIAAWTTGPAVVPNANEVEIYTGVDCNTAGNGLATTAQSRAVAIIYGLENGTGATESCIDAS